MNEFTSNLTDLRLKLEIDIILTTKLKWFCSFLYMYRHFFLAVSV